ncbi:MAG: hypothetical protein ACD_41C00238G0003 [uncultured bacterium]|nr:MAG: hypothetical protein ACD_41C00238G0003 [uncultured bacterium]
MTYRRLLYLTVVVVGTFTAPATYAKDIYLDATLGNDSNACTSVTAPCASFSGVESIVEPGDDLYVSGSFSGGIILNNSFRGTSAKTLTIQPWTGQTDPVITASDDDIVGLSITGDYVSVSGFTFNTTNTASAFTTTADQVTLQDSTITGSGMIPISVAGGTGNSLIGNTIEAGLVGINITGSQHTINRNTVYCADGEQCNIAISLTAADSFIVANNVIFNFVDSISEAINPIAFSIDSTSTDNVIAHNTTYNNVVAVSTNNAAGTILRNNIFAMEDNQYVYSYTSSGDFLSETNADYNDYYLAGANSAIGFVDTGTTIIQSLSDWRSTTGFDTNSISTDPLFTAAYSATPDLSLLADSPAIDAGVDFPGVIDDYDGKTRPVGDAPDLGAFEYGSASDSVTVDAPTHIVVSPISIRTATINWQAPDLVSYYEVQYGYKKNFNKSKTATNIAKTHYRLKKRQSNKKTWFRVRAAYVSAGTTYYSDWTTRNGFLTKPASPKKVVVTDHGDSLVTVRLVFKKKKIHVRKKLTALVELRTPHGKKVDFRKVGATADAKKQRCKVKLTGQQQTQQFVIPAQYVGRQLQFRVRFKRNASRKSPWKKSAGFSLVAS